MTKVCLVGLGLIGGSLGQALRRVRRQGRRVYRVSGWGRSAARLKQAKRLGAVDDVSTHPSAVLRDADVVVLCVPVQSLAAVAQQAVPFLKPGAVLTDVGSVKERIDTQIKKLLSRRSSVHWVGSHPIAGSEKTGVRHARPDLFQRATCVLTSSSKRSTGLKKVQRLWTDVGARCLFLSSRSHDHSLALTSHLPHLLAFALFSLVQKKGRVDPRWRPFMGASFRDVTRIAASDPEVWTGIFDLNKKEIQAWSRAFHQSLQSLLKDSGKKLKKKLETISKGKQRSLQNNG